MGFVNMQLLEAGTKFVVVAAKSDIKTLHDTGFDVLTLVTCGM
jgi:hypothetical protein